MWAWRKRKEEITSWRGTARAGLAGATREELMREALHSLSLDGRADRIGVWLEQDSFPCTDPLAATSLRGMLWESGGDDAPEEWEKLSLEPPLPQELLASGKSVYQVLEDSHGQLPNRPMIGPLVGLRHALWTPIEGKGRLCGVILTGSRRRQPSLPRELTETLAAELALALEWEQEQRLARERQADVRLSKQILAALSSGASPDTILSQLAASCTETSEAASGAGASFAVIAQLPPQASSASPFAGLDFAWESGNSEWTRAMEREPLATQWRAAVQSGNVVGADPPATWCKGGLARLVAIPLLARGETLGVLVAGISQKSPPLITLERLELRAALAVTALERRKARAEQIRRTARRHVLLDFSPEPTLLLDTQGNIAGLNRAAKALLEEKRGERTPESLLEQDCKPTPPEPLCVLGGRFANLFCTREQQRIEEWSIRSLAGERQKALGLHDICEAELVNGVRVRLHAPLFAGEDHVAVVLAQAATEEASQQRSHSDAELQNVLEWVEEGILLFGPNQGIRAMNTRFAQIAGLSPEQAAASTTLDHLIAHLAQRAAEPQQFADRWRELARGADGGTREELQLARPVPRVLERSVRPVLDHAGQRLGRVEIYRDLTAQRVFQAKLLQTEKLAALGQMVTGIAHELSNPLTSILGYSQRLLVRKDRAGRTEEARQIYEEAERASTILRQLLLSAREARPERKRVSLNQVVQRAMELQRFGSASEKIRIELDLDPTLPFVTGDPGQLQQVLMNLIGNARQAIVLEGKAGTIRLRTAKSGESRIVLEVMDDGPGVPQTIQARIFDPFFTTKPAGVGTGLGLAVVLGVAREHGGQVRVASPSEGGSVFTVELPVAAESSVEPAPLSPETADHPMQVSHSSSLPKNRAHLLPKRALRSNHRGARVLVVEDEPTVARLIADVLEDEGLHVDVLLDGREGLERAGRETFDLVVCDMKMPGVDGQHFFKSLARARNPLQEKFLFVTGDVIAHQTQEFLERNSLPHVAKPFRVEELTEKVFSLLDSQRARRGRAAAAKKAH
jgi:signal transduction histidine kinase/ActR/RegA family two-component response regulator